MEKEMMGCVPFAKYLPFIYPSQMDKMGNSTIQTNKDE